MLSELKISSYHPALGGSVLASVLTLVARRLHLLVRAAKNRRDAAMLARLDDRMLSDIGLTRSDLRDAYAEPLWRDPTCILAARAGERRAYRRGFGSALSNRAPLSPSIVPHEGYLRPATGRPSRYAV